MGNIILDLAIENPKWQNIINDAPFGENWIARLIKDVIATQNLEEHGDITIALMLAGDTKITELNQEFRDKDKPTNILSFGNDDFGNNDHPEEISNFLGDIIIAYETVLKEAQEQQKEAHNHLAHLIIHGILHLLGYDHEETQEAEEMEALEIEILKKWGIDNPYFTIC